MNIFVNEYSNTSRDTSNFIVDMDKVGQLAREGKPGYAVLEEQLLKAARSEDKGHCVEDGESDAMYDCKPDFFRTCAIKPPCQIDVVIDWVVPSGRSRLRRNSQSPLT